MTLTTKLTTLGLIAALAGASLAPAIADQQSDKNNARNLALGGAAVALYGILNHNSTATLLGAAGAAIAGSQYETDRHNQSVDNSRYYHYDRGGYNGGYDRDGYDRNGWNRDGYNRDGFNRDGQGREYRNYDNHGNDNGNRDGQYQNSRQNQPNKWQRDGDNHGDRY